MKAIALIISPVLNTKSLSRLVALGLLLLVLPGCATSGARSVRTLDASWQTTAVSKDNNACKESYARLFAVNLPF